MARELIEIFGYSPNDLTKSVRSLWALGACPFISHGCSKHNHDQSIIYGTCSVSSPFGDLIICPNRLYANDYAVIKRVAMDAFGTTDNFFMYDEYIRRREDVDRCIVALGMNSGKEVKVGRSLSMDWVLAKIVDGCVVEYVGVEVQSIDITGNYRDAWHGHKNYKLNQTSTIPSSEHGLNWANVHKRLIPQIIRKGLVYSKSSLVNHGLYFIVPDIVFQKFEDILGEIPATNDINNTTITIFTYGLGPSVPLGKSRDLIEKRMLRINLAEFSQRFISGPNLPNGIELDNTVKRILGITSPSLG